MVVAMTDDRAAFEVWARDHGEFPLHGLDSPDGWYYGDDETQAAWSGWQAATARQSAGVDRIGSRCATCGSTHPIARNPVPLESFGTESCRDPFHDIPAIVDAALGSGREEPRVRPCGCVVCTCATEDRCLGCGAKMCDEHKAAREVPRGR